MRLTLSIIYIKTLLELAEYRQTPIMAKIYKKLSELELKLYRKDKKFYAQCIDIAKDVWDDVKKGHPSFLIDIEPLLFELYGVCEQEFKKAKIKPTLFNKLFEHYSNDKPSEYEVRSLRLSDEIWSVTNKVMMQRIGGN